MRSLKQFVFEEYNTVTLNGVTVKYNIEPQDFVVQAPEAYTESDIQSFLDDKCLQELPTNDEKAKKFFGNNAQNIVDSYFEYKSFEKLQHGEDYNLEWDSHYGDNKDDKIGYFKLRGLEYIIVFEQFTIQLDSEDKIEDILSKVFEATESNDANEYPIIIKFDKNKLEYKE